MNSAFCALCATVIVIAAVCPTAKGGPIHDRAARSVVMQRWGQVQSCKLAEIKAAPLRGHPRQQWWGGTAEEDLIIVGVRVTGSESTYGCFLSISHSERGVSVATRRTSLEARFARLP